MKRVFNKADLWKSVKSLFIMVTGLWIILLGAVLYGPLVGYLYKLPHPDIISTVLNDILSIATLIFIVAWGIVVAMKGYSLRKEYRKELESKGKQDDRA